MSTDGEGSCATPRGLKLHPLSTVEDVLSKAVAGLVECTEGRITAKVESIDFQPRDLGASALVRGAVRMTIVFDHESNTWFLDALEERWKAGG